LKKKIFEFSNFIKEGKPDYDLIMKNILLPYFKMKSRILKQGSFFKIGEMGFKVSGLSPTNKGIISSKTYIQCNRFYSTKQEIKRALLLTLQKYDNFNQQSLIKEFFENEGNHHLIIKDDKFQLKNYEFYIRNSEPESGIINSDTVITIENRNILPLSKIKLCVIKNNVPRFTNTSDKLIFEEFILKEYFEPYYFSGVKKYIERGDIIPIEDIQIFILNCFPDYGFVTRETQLVFKFGLSIEECLQKINTNDLKYTMNLAMIEDRMTTENRIRNNTFRDYLSNMFRTQNNNNNNNNINNNNNNIPILNDRRNYIEFHESSVKLETAKTILPNFEVNEENLKIIKNKNEDVLKKCIICMCEFEIKENLKTLPCFHIFHSNCIDEWITNNPNCPMCKTNII